MAEIVRRRSWGGVLPLGRHVSISGSRSIHAPSVSIAPSSFQEGQNANPGAEVQGRTGSSFLGGGGLSSVRVARFLILLSYVDLSIVTPASALIFVVGTFSARFLLDEEITAQRWIGSCLVCVGVALTASP